MAQNKCNILQSTLLFIIVLLLAFSWGITNSERLETALSLIGSLPGKMDLVMIPMTMALFFLCNWWVTRPALAFCRVRRSNKV